MRCILSTPTKTDDWRHTSRFQAYYKCGDAVCKVVIDGGSSMNVVSKFAISRMKLKPEPHPQPYRVAWVDKTSLPITERCLVPIQMGDYLEKIWCDVLPMDVAHVLLGHPWLYDMNVTHYGRSNTYIIKHNGKSILVKLAKPSKKDKSKKNLKGKAESGLVLFVVAKEDARVASVESTINSPEIATLLKELQDVAPEELPSELPPLRDIKLAIDLVPRSQLPNLPHYRMIPKEHAELQQVDELLERGFIHESLSPCAVASLINS
ncbi:PREDICTED: uncharacterized protein LOC104594433 [Nelumbo nucifera]|uniref:Uncharacterized protein LOC104594433 n=1 Tax=Nelumbo nucifera TaxID=4432 RepID=A0A1U7ZWW9_NELNU|nr:PREDICTED: uncharacterized protein LOC104594433 [Nelumbo nucifera]